MASENIEDSDKSAALLISPEDKSMDSEIRMPRPYECHSNSFSTSPSTIRARDQDESDSLLITVATPSSAPHMANFKLSYNDSEDEFGSYEDESEAKGAN